MGRGSSKAGGGGNTFSSVEDFEKTIKDMNDPRVEEFSRGYSEESDYTEGLKKNLNRAIDEDGYKAAESAILSEEKATRAELSNLPKNKTPGQLGEAEALKERLDVIEELKKRKGNKGKGQQDVDIVTEKRR